MYDVSVFGLGYIGCVSAASLARAGHRVIGVDSNPAKVAMIRDRLPTVREPQLEALVREQVEQGRLSATTSAREAVLRSSISLVSVGTPSQDNGNVDLSAIQRVVSEIGAALADKTDRHLVAVRSTVPPGTVANMIIPELERASGKKAGIDFDVCMNPEFLRTGSAVNDFIHPPYVLVGTESPAVAAIMRELYTGVIGPFHVVPLAVAEMVKYVCNAFRAVKVAFANEIGNLCAALGVPGADVMQLVVADTKLNISPIYLRPGAPFGGSCLPKDVRALVYTAQKHDVAAPLLAGALESNRAHAQRAFQIVTSAKKRKVGLLGLTFKRGTDDLRESHAVTLAEMLVGKGYKLAIYDPDLEEARLLGRNREYIEREIPHLGELLRPSAEAVIDESEVIVLAKDAPELRAALGRARAEQVAVDLVGALDRGSVPADLRKLCP
jgi:GDP-mannose 6-dehydrogenase